MDICFVIKWKKYKIIFIIYLQGHRVFITPNTKPGTEILAGLVKAVHGLVCSSSFQLLYSIKRRIE